MNLNERDGHICCLNLFNTHNSGNIMHFCFHVFTHESESTHGV